MLVLLDQCDVIQLPLLHERRLFLQVLLHGVALGLNVFYYLFEVLRYQLKLVVLVLLNRVELAPDLGLVPIAHFPLVVHFALEAVNELLDLGYVLILRRRLPSRVIVQAQRSLLHLMLPLLRVGNVLLCHPYLLLFSVCRSLLMIHRHC